MLSDELLDDEIEVVDIDESANAKFEGAYPMISAIVLLKGES